jgi:hypothetical protein
MLARDALKMKRHRAFVEYDLSGKSVLPSGRGPMGVIFRTMP